MDGNSDKSNRALRSTCQNETMTPRCCLLPVLLLCYNILVKSRWAGRDVLLASVGKSKQEPKASHSLLRAEQIDTRTLACFLPWSQPASSALTGVARDTMLPHSGQVFLSQSSVNHQTVSHRHFHSQPVQDKALIETAFLGDSRL